MFINLLGQNSLRLKIAVKEVFKVISNMINTEQLDEILNLLKLGENEKEEEEVEEDSSSDEEDDNIEFPTNAGDEEEDEDGDEKEKKEDDDEKEDEKEDDEDEDEKDDDEEEEDKDIKMDDFEAYDKGIAEALKLKKKESNKKKVAKMSLVHFKLRLIELLSIYSISQVYIY